MVSLLLAAVRSLWLVACLCACVVYYLATAIRHGCFVVPLMPNARRILVDEGGGFAYDVRFFENAVPVKNYAVQHLPVAVLFLFSVVLLFSSAVLFFVVGGCLAIKSV